MEKQQKEDYGKPLSSTFESLIKEVETGPFYPGPPRMSAKKEPLSQKEIALIDDFREQVYNNGILSQKEIDEILEKHGLRADRPITQEEIDNIIDKLQPFSACWQDLNDAIDAYLESQKKGFTNDANYSDYFGLIDDFRARIYRGKKLTQEEIDKILEEHGLRINKPITQEEIDVIINKLQPYEISWEKLNQAIDDYLNKKKRSVITRVNNSEYFGLIDHIFSRVVDGGCIPPNGLEKELEKQGIKPTRWGDPGFVEAMKNIEKAREALKDCK